MRNAKEEFIEETKNDKVICAIISTKEDYVRYKPKAILEKGYSPEDYEKFLRDIDYNYDSGFGGQELFGVILCENGVWFDRGEYDGSEWWERNEYPDWEGMKKVFSNSF